jgi:uroporphyrinogen decarboxylase
MSPRENLLAALRREHPVEVPIDIALVPDQLRRFRDETGSADVADYFRFCHRGVAVQMDGSRDPERLYPGVDLPTGTVFDPWGVAHSPGSDAAFHMTRLHHPLKGDVSENEVASYPMPVVRAGELQRLTEQVDALHGRGLAVIGGLAQTVWETAWAIRSMEDLMVDMLAEEQRAVILLDRITESSRRRGEILASAGVDVLHLGDDIGMQSTPLMSLELWRAWLKPRLRSVIDAARQTNQRVLILYHSCGFVEPFIDELIEIGVDVLNPVQPESMSFDDLHRKYGDRLSFWGTIGTQSTLPFGTPDDVRNVVRHNLEVCGDAGGIVVGPTHVIEPEVPWENIMAIREVCDELSRGFVTK